MKIAIDSLYSYEKTQRLDKALRISTLYENLQFEDITESYQDIKLSRPSNFLTCDANTLLLLEITYPSQCLTNRKKAPCQFEVKEPLIRRNLSRE